MKVMKRLKDAWRKNAPEIVAWWSGTLPEFVTARRPHEPLAGVPVFCYHMVAPASFEADLQFLQRNGYRTLGADEFVDYLEGRLNLPHRSVLLTFDDGPRNFYDVAFPLLRQYAAKALAFIAPGLHASSSAEDVIEARPMTWEEVQIVYASGLVEFHSHTFESRYIPNWPMPVPLAGCEPAIEAGRRRTPEALGRDLALSQQEIEMHLPGAKVHQLSFPMYQGSEAAALLAQSVGFKACHWGLVPGRPLNRPGDSPLYISRVSDEFLRRLPGEGRVSFAHLLRERLNRVRAAHDWRRRYGELEI